MTNKGKKFELDVFNKLKQSLDQGDLGFDPKFCEVYHRKNYNSRDRKKDIVVDISVELNLDPKSAMIKWIWECKNLNRKVEPGDVEKFHSNLQQIGAHKGTVVSRNGFQEGAINFSESKGIGLARLLPEDRMQFVVNTNQDTTSLDRQMIIDALTLEKTETMYLQYDFYSLSRHSVIHCSFQEFILDQIEELKNAH